jgi:lysophospholipase L1-like esterase
MRKLQRERGSHFDLSADDLHMNDAGYRHLAQHVAATIIAAIPRTASGNLTAVRQ